MVIWEWGADVITFVERQLLQILILDNSPLESLQPNHCPTQLFSSNSGELWYWSSFNFNLLWYWSSFNINLIQFQTWMPREIAPWKSQTRVFSTSSSRFLIVIKWFLSVEVKNLSLFLTDSSYFPKPMSYLWANSRANDWTFSNVRSSNFSILWIQVLFKHSGGIYKRC